MDDVVLEDDVAGAGVAVAGLADGADVDEGFVFGQAVLVAEFFGAEEIEALGEDAGDVGVALEAVVFDHREDFFHLPLVVDVFGEDVFVQGVAGRAVDEHQAVFAEVAGAFAEEVPPLGVIDGTAAGHFQLFASPKNGSFGTRVEAFGVEQGTLIVVSQDTKFAFHDTVDALAWIGTVADDVAQAKDFVNPLLFDVSQHNLQCFQVAVDIAYNCPFHAVSSQPRE